MHTKDSLGVVIGRFQTDELHEGHLYLINFVRHRHEQVLILVGDREGRPTARDPYPFSIRKAVLQQPFPDVTIKRLVDSPISNVHWSETVDAAISATANGSDAVLYGSRDSFIPAYTGGYDTYEVPALSGCSATKRRQEQAAVYVDDPMWRRGWLAAIHHCVGTS